MATPTSAKNWKKAKGEELTLPSGNVCLIKRVGMEKLFSAGVLPDELTKIAIEQIEKAQSGGKPQDHKKPGGDEIDPELMKKFLTGENAIVEIFESFDRVTAMCVIEPKILYHKEEMRDGEGKFVGWREIPASRRYSDEHHEDHEFYREDPPLYTDEVDMEDKTFIFNVVVGGTRDLEQFREEHGDALATLQSGEDVQHPSKSTDGGQE